MRFLVFLLQNYHKKQKNQTLQRKNLGLSDYSSNNPYTNSNVHKSGISKLAKPKKICSLHGANEDFQSKRNADINLYVCISIYPKTPYLPQLAQPAEAC